MSLPRLVDRAFSHPDLAVLIKGSSPTQSISQVEIARSELEDFIYDRLRGYYTDRGVTAAQFDAVQNVVHASLPDFESEFAPAG